MKHRATRLIYGSSEIPSCFRCGCDVGETALLRLVSIFTYACHTRQWSAFTSNMFTSGTREIISKNTVNTQILLNKKFPANSRSLALVRFCVIFQRLQSPNRHFPDLRCIRITKITESLTKTLFARAPHQKRNINAHNITLSRFMKKEHVKIHRQIIKII